MDTYSVKLSKLATENNLKVVYAASDYDDIEIDKDIVNRPGLPFSGFYEYFRSEIIYAMGKTEAAFLRTLDEEQRERTMEKFFSHEPAALVVCNRVVPDISIVNAARKYDITLFITDLDTSATMARLIISLRNHLAPRMTVHGVFVQIHGEGVLIFGESGIGKSETALELIKRGHRLIADDAVEIRRVSRYSVTGMSPSNIRHMMEIRGIGIIDVRQLYGVGAVLPRSQIHLVVKFESWDENKVYDRLGLEEDSEDFLGVKVPKLTIPVAPARNLAIILEVAALNNRLKKMGINAAQRFVENYDSSISSGSFESEEDFNFNYLNEFTD
ncbi:MAG: HPr(Ser) kinase/phosphatase [Oscillospiraceae bacterium]|nr:HPr(Ser) kinase/phosphatase [Oscillospiraceae bacterium]